jgi:quercetin dioxygenase-like cupin family protein
MSRFFPERSECGQHAIFGTIPVRTYAGDQVQLSLVEMPPRSVIEEHSHANEQIGMVVAGQATFTIGGETRLLRAGDFYFMPGGTPHRVVTDEEPLTALDVFYPIRDEYR